MIPKPTSLGPQFAARFQDLAVVAAYQYRIPYPPETFIILSDLITDEPRTVLDVGCGPGNIARNLVHLVDRIDAVDVSQPMLEEGRSLPNGNHPNLNWLCGRIEEISLSPSFALITAGASLHWMEWDIVLPRFHDILTPNGHLAVLETSYKPLPWSDDLSKLIKLYSTNPDYQPINLIQELENRGLFQQQGEKETTPIPFTQSIDHYIASFHSMSSLTRASMTEEKAIAFDNELRALITRFCSDGEITMQIVSTVIWGKPQGTTIVQAQPSELDLVLDILEEAAQWLTSRGIDQWQPGTFLASSQSIAEQIERGEVYLAKRAGQPIGTLTLQWTDTFFWGNQLPDAGYIHHIAIRRAFAGIGLGRQLLQWSERTVATAEKSYLRLDCMTDNHQLCAYYEQAGFTYKGKLEGKRWSANLYEKPVTGETHP